MSSLGITIRNLAVATAIVLHGMPANADISVRGRLIDQANEPVAGARLSASAPAFGRTLWRGCYQMLTTSSDSDGRFVLRLPFGGLRYQILPEKAGYSLGSSHSFLAKDGDELSITMSKSSATHTLAGRIFDDEAPAANLQVTLLGELPFEARTETQPDGTFRFDRIPEYLGQGVLLASRGGRVLPLLVARGKEIEHLKLVQPATLQGVARDALDERPVPGAIVTARTWFMSGFTRAATTDEKGRWQITGLPPCEYIVTAEGENHVSTRERGHNGDSNLKLAPDGTTKLELAMAPKAAISGIVIDHDGRPVANALVGMPHTWDPQRYEFVRWVRTDSAGAFAIKTGLFREAPEIAAFDADSGFARLTLATPSKGAKWEGVRLRLNGSVQIRGTVFDEAGRAIEHVMLQAPWSDNTVLAESDESGRFDFGRIPLSDGANAKYVIRARPPRPAGGTSLLLLNRQRISDADVAVQSFYADADAPFQPVSGKSSEVRITLKATDLLVFSGRVTDEAGKAPAQASVHLFAGTADENWDVIAAPPLLGSSKDRSSRSVEIGRAPCDAKGMFRVHAVRADGERADVNTRYSIGVIVHGPRPQPKKLIKDVMVHRDQREINLDVSLAK